MLGLAASPSPRLGAPQSRGSPDHTLALSLHRAHRVCHTRRGPRGRSPVLADPALSMVEVDGSQDRVPGHLFASPGMRRTALPARIGRPLHHPLMHPRTALSFARISLRADIAP